VDGAEPVAPLEVAPDEVPLGTSSTGCWRTAAMQLISSCSGAAG